jgi:hypothetical protein
MPTTKDLIPSIKICVCCRHFRNDFIEVLDPHDGHLMDSEHYWLCEVLDGALFFDPAKAMEGGAVIELETNLPLKCPYTLEQALTQEDAGRERWGDLLPLLKAKAMSQQV